MKHSLVNSNFSRTYNPSGRQNALSDIKRLLTSREPTAQEKGCGYLIEVLSRYNKESNQRTRLIEYLLDNDITVFLCEVTSNLDLNLFRSFVRCVRLLWCARLFTEQHAAQCAAAALRALQQHTGAIEPMHFLCDLLNGIPEFKAIPAFSPSSAFSVEQLLACLSSLAPRTNTSSTVLASALVLQALVSYQPDDLDLRSQTGVKLVEVLGVWFGLLVGSLNHSMLTGDKEMSGMFFAVTCKLGLDVMRLAKLLNSGKQNPSFVQSILADKQEITALKQCAGALRDSIHRVLLELVSFTKENQGQLSSEEYGVFLKFMLNFLYDATSEQLPEFCDVLFSKGYLIMLPQCQIDRNDIMVRNVSTLILGEMLKGLAQKYLDVGAGSDHTCARDIHMGLVELQNGIEQPHNVGDQLQKRQPYSLLVYIYFYCQSSDDPEKATAPLLPYLMEHILRLPKSFTPPPYIIKALWLVFAMSSISSGTLSSLNERVYLEKATDRLISMLCPEPSLYYTHNPALLLWAFTSHRIHEKVRLQVLSQWFKIEDSLPSELISDPAVWELLLSILTSSKDIQVLQNCNKTIYSCLEEIDDDGIEDFGLIVWPMLPEVLAKALIDFDSTIETNICYLLELSSALVPEELDDALCLKLAVLTTAIFTKDRDEARYDFEFACLRLSLYLLSFANKQNDNRVLVTYINRAGFLPRLVSVTNSMDNKVACIALQLLSYIVHYFTKNNYQPRSLLQIQSHQIIKSLRDDSSSERGASLLQLLYMVLNSGPNSPLVLSCDLEVSNEQQYDALRALMLRIQMLCCKESKNQPSGAWKTLGAIYRHAIFNRSDSKLVATLTSQPWTHTLIHFQITQDITEEFLTFTQTWLSLMKITLKNSREKKGSRMCKQSLVCKTLLLIKKYVVVEEAEDGDDVKEKILGTVKEILDDSELNV
ncbi:uncharacterized protein LOC133527577 [Cydia pomonella]|uniref:uncharacterized protein LOC133527577 n=1 Tax=Cydia pomonella TaxID=82600 RepID=UPI002ADE0399|nr:uncharacterized protein LOC133527577 [Cydia pomonella]